MYDDDDEAGAAFEDEADDADQGFGFTESDTLEFDRESELVPIILRRRYSLSLRPNAEERIVLAEGLDCSRMRVGAMAVLVHEQLRFTNTATLDFLLYNMIAAPEAPDQPIVDTTRSLLSVPPTITSSTQAGTYRITTLVPPIGAQLQLTLRMRQFASDASDQVATLSVFLLARTRQ